MVDAIANLATSTASDPAAIAQLMSMVDRLMAELVTLNAELGTALQIQRASRGGRGGRGAGAPAQTGAGAVTRAKEQDLKPPIHYRSTCSPGCKHNRAKCPAPSTGYIYTATKRDMQGREEATK